MRLIDANDLWCDIQMLPHNGDMISSEEVEQAIADATTIDAVPVVRCKDCKWGIDSAANPLIKWCNQHATHFKNNDFCSYGERKDGEG